MDDIIQHMEHLIEELVTIQNFVFCLVVWGMVYGLRRVAETIWVGADKNKYWRELIMPFSPVLIGAALAAVMKAYPFPAIFAASWQARAFVGSVFGGISGHVYRIVNALFLKKEKELLGEDGKEEKPNG